MHITNSINSSMRFLISVAVLALSLALPVYAAAEPPILDASSRFHPVYSPSGMVVSQEVLASRVGAEILSRGGNAIDAAVATGFALAVTLPRAGNLAGGGFMLIYLADEKKTIALDFREMAPAAANRDMFLDAAGDVDNQLARYSMKSSGVPGTVAGLLHAQQNYGVLKLKQVMAPAIALAGDGFAVSLDLATVLESRFERLSRNAASKAYFYKTDGKLYLPGEQLIQQDLAATLQRIAKDGRDGFYQGQTAELITAEMLRTGGLITAEDLTNYRVVTRAPVCGDFHHNKVCAMPPPSSGGVHLVQMLNILEGWDLKPLGHNSAAYIHRLVEAMRRAYADRSAYLGDPDFYGVPTKAIIDKRYATTLRESIALDRASKSDQVNPGLAVNPESLKITPSATDRESTETTHFSSWDRWGNVVSTTTTLNFSFGNGISVAGAGFLMNNEMDDFSAKPNTPNVFNLLGGTANEIQPGKRPLSSMTPTLVFDAGGHPIIATGSPGGSTIITVVLQTLLNILTFDMGVAEASSVARVHHQWFPDKLYYESGISADTLELLNIMGHTINATPRILGATQSIQKGPDNSLLGAADPRRQGAGAIAER